MINPKLYWRSLGAVFLVLVATPLIAQTTSVFTQQPTPAVVVAGGTADFSFAVQIPLAFANLGIVVFRAGVNVSDRFSFVSQNVGSAVTGSVNFTTGTFTVRISGVTQADVGVYTFEITANNARYLETSSQPVSLTIGTAAAPTIVTQPSSQVASFQSRVTFSVVATGVPSPGYQWYKNGTAISGAQTATYTSTVVGTDAGAYYVTVTNSSGAVVSDHALLEFTAGSGPAIQRQPTSADVIVGQSATFSVGVNDNVPPTYQWFLNGRFINGATGSSYTVSAASATNAGSYSVIVANTSGSTTSAAAALRIVLTTGPTIQTQPARQSVPVGGEVTFTIAAAGNPTPSYQWLKDGAIIVGATGSSLRLTNVSPSNAGVYSAQVTNSVASVRSADAALTVTTASRLSNLAVRTTLVAEQILIVGFTMQGGAKSLLLRAAGPSLGALGVPGTMPDPKLALFNDQMQIAANDNWGGNQAVASTAAAVGAFPFAATTSLDAALVASVEGGRTLQVSGTASGNVIVEAYDAGSGTSPRLTNLSALNKVGTGDDVLIAGFTIAGIGSKNLLVRAAGPSLIPLGVGGTLADPKFEIFSSDNRKVGESDNYSPTLTSIFSSVGAFAFVPGSKDAAVTLALPPGGYTVIVSGSDGGTGVALVEIYEIP